MTPVSMRVCRCSIVLFLAGALLTSVYADSPSEHRLVGVYTIRSAELVTQSEEGAPRDRFTLPWEGNEHGVRCSLDPVGTVVFLKSGSFRIDFSVRADCPLGQELQDWLAGWTIAMQGYVAITDATNYRILGALHWEGRTTEFALHDNDLPIPKNWFFLNVDQRGNEYSRWVEFVLQRVDE